jgi:putative membrane protein
MTSLARRTSAILAVVLAVALSSGSPAQAAPSPQDVQFLRTVHQSNLVVISTSQFAQQRAVTDQIKSLGARLLANHTKLEQQVSGAAATLSVSLPEIPTAEQDAKVTRLGTASGTEFDRMYLETQLQEHATAMRLTDTELANGSDPVAMNVAADAAPVLKAHHDALASAARALGVPDEVDTGSGGSAAPEDNRSLGVLLVTIGLAVVAVGAFLFLRRRGRR